MASFSLAYPFMTLRHVPSAAYDATTLEWVMRHHLVEGEQVEHFERIICGTAARYGFPSASDEVVGLAADLISWLFLFDDAYPEGAYRVDARGLEAACARYAQLLEGYPRVAPHSNFAVALMDLRQRMLRLAPADWFVRFTESFRYYCAGCVREARFRQSNGVPTVAQYLELRRASFGYAPVCDLMESIFGTFLTDEERRSSEVVRLRTLGVDVSAWVNDLFSYEKERAVGDVCNLVRVVELNEQLSTERARERVGQMHNEALAELLVLERRIRESPATPAVRNLARAICEWSQGHHDWSLRCARYKVSPRVLGD